MYNDRDRPPWLRSLRPPRSEPEDYAPAPTVAEPVVEPDAVQRADRGRAGSGGRGHRGPDGGRMGFSDPTLRRPRILVPRLCPQEVLEEASISLCVPITGEGR